MASKNTLKVIDCCQGSPEHAAPAQRSTCASSCAGAHMRADQRMMLHRLAQMASALPWEAQASKPIAIDRSDSYRVYKTLDMVCGKAARPMEQVLLTSEEHRSAWLQRSMCLQCVTMTSRRLARRLRPPLSSLPAAGQLSHLYQAARLACAIGVVVSSSGKTGMPSDIALH